MRRGLFLALIGTVCFMGCSIPFMGETTSKAPAIEAIKRTPVDKIVITELDILDRPYMVLEEVSVIEKSLIPFKNLDQADAAMKLREEAAKLDADAIIFVTFKNSDASWTGTKSIEAKGKAIRFSRY